MIPREIQSPAKAIVKELVASDLLACVLNGRVIEVSIVDTSWSPAIGDTVIIELLPAGRQWLLLAVVP
jgi:hypothetical protein